MEQPLLVRWVRRPNASHISITPILGRGCTDEPHWYTTTQASNCISVQATCHSNLTPSWNAACNARLSKSSIARPTISGVAVAAASEHPKAQAKPSIAPRFPSSPIQQSRQCMAALQTPRSKKPVTRAIATPTHRVKLGQRCPGQNRVLLVRLARTEAELKVRGRWHSPRG